MAFEIVYMREDLIAGWQAGVDSVARERIYLSRVEMPPSESGRVFARKMIENNWPMFCALDDARDSQVIGWADVSVSDIPECSHRGTLGMGLLPEYRGQGLGRRLLEACLAHAPQCGIEKVELTVYADNAPAIALYRKLGFVDIGTISDYRRLDGRSVDTLLMERRVPLEPKR